MRLGSLLNFAFLGFALSGLSCTAIPSGYGIGGPRNITQLPSSPVPTTPISTPTDTGAQGGGACGLNGSFGLCETLIAGDTKSLETFIVISGCSRYEIRQIAYVNLGCQAADEYYERTLTYNMTASPSSTGTQAIDLDFVNIIEEFTTLAYSGTNQDDYLYCLDIGLDTFQTTPTVSQSGVACYTPSGGTTAKTLSYQIARVTSQGLYLGLICDGNNGQPDDGAPNGECTTLADRPSSFQANGYPVWQ